MSARDGKVDQLYQTVGAYGYLRREGSDGEALAKADEIVSMLSDMNLSNWAWRADEHDRRLHTLLRG